MENGNGPPPRSPVSPVARLDTVSTFVRRQVSRPENRRALVIAAVVIALMRGLPVPLLGWQRPKLSPTVKSNSANLQAPEPLQASPL